MTHTDTHRAFCLSVFWPPCSPFCLMAVHEECLLSQQSKAWRLNLCVWDLSQLWLRMTLVIILHAWVNPAVISVCPKIVANTTIRKGSHLLSLFPTLDAVDLAIGGGDQGIHAYLPIGMKGFGVIQERYHFSKLMAGVWFTHITLDLKF